jgi:hypothetical protein
MTASKQKTKRVRKDGLTPAERREIERATYEPAPEDRVSQRLRDVLGDASSRGKYFMNQIDRLRTLAGALAPLMQDLYEQADDLRWTLKEVDRTRP